MEELRKVEVFKDDGWSEIQFVDLEVDDKFRMFEPDGSPVIGLAGATEWLVTKGPRYHNKGRTLEVECVAGGGGLNSDSL